MKINFNEKDKLLNLEIDEEIDHHKAEILRRNADYEIQRRNPKRVILDFNNVYFMDSAGIGMVIGRYKTASMVGAKLEMKNVRKNIRKIFEMTGVLKIIPIIEEEEKSEREKKFKNTSNTCCNYINITNCFCRNFWKIFKSI